MYLLIGIEKEADKEMLQKATDIYTTKYNIKPQICYVNRKTFSEDFNQKSFMGIEIVFDDKLKIGDFAMRVE